ncbi:unnamed protein product [Arabidopsis arenosa]|uniref:non-specific serine/threonine protein kinase n=1 Tax=Arabidopsis arenosa TaxID=38785 RepID=A0A8S1ZMR8_ARAAE|nr:unnamed protein product [Arabidopsis arenosa]
METRNKILLAVCATFSILNLVESQNYQQGFISLDCGLPLNESPYNDSVTTLTYISDANFTRGGKTGKVEKYLEKHFIKPYTVLRYFPDGIRNCYSLSVKQDTKYLIRTVFLYGNYDGLNTSPRFDLYLGPNIWTTVDVQISGIGALEEIIHITRSNIIEICLVKTGTSTPMISAIELRPLQYNTYIARTGSLKRLDRLYFTNSNESLRYPKDVRDRIWFPYFEQEWTQINTTLNVSDSSDGYDPPLDAFKTAAIPTNASEKMTITWSLDISDDQTYCYIYVADIQQVRSNEIREFEIVLNGKVHFEPYRPKRFEVKTFNNTVPQKCEGGVCRVELSRTSRSTLPPLMNAFEIFRVIDFPQPETNQNDVIAIRNIQSTSGLNRISWQGDPCVPKQFMWIGLSCSVIDMSTPPRIIALDLSSSGLTGIVPPSIQNLSQLQELDLSKNNLTGDVPEFLAKMKSLLVINLSGNNLSGSVPRALLDRKKEGLKLVLEGNTKLCVACGTKFPVVLVVASVSSVAIIIIGLVLIVLVRRRKQSAGKGKRSGSVLSWSSRLKIASESALEYSTNVEIWREHPPSSYSLKINTLSKLNSDIYKSRRFLSGGYNCEVFAYLVFFAYNKKANKYFTIQDVEVKRFNALRTVWGLPQVLSLGTFNDPKNGIIFEGEQCEFGVDVMVAPPFNKWEVVSFDEKLYNPKFSWNVKNFLMLRENLYISNSFPMGGRKWVLKLYPKCFSTSDGKWISIFLHLEDNERLMADERIYTRGKLRVLDPRGSNHATEKFICWHDESNSGTGHDQIMSSMAKLRESYLDKEGTLTTESLTISSNKTIISPSQIFELGFFNLASSSRWYLGIWYKIISIRTYVWVANRDNPLSNSNGTLKISENNLVIFDQSDRPVWSTNITGGDVRSPVVAELLDNGNFLLRDSNNRLLWQSFDFPTDTLLEEMKLGWDHKNGFNRILRSWKTTEDPSSGDFSTKLETSEFPEFYICNKESIRYRSGPWNGIGFSSVAGTNQVGYIVYNFTKNGSAGCMRKTRLSCEGRDGFARLKRMKLPDTTATIVDREIGLKVCKERCLKDCNCTAFANADIRNGGSGCVIWTGEILDTRAEGGQDLYVRLAAADLGDKRIKNEKMIGSSIGMSILLLISFIIFHFWKRKQKRSIAIQTPIVDQVRSQDSLMNEVIVSSRSYKSEENKTEYLDLPLIEWEALAMATNNFSKDNTLGQGGFGIVYKGRLLDGKEIAIISGKRNKGFYNSNRDLNLLSFVWRHWKEGKGLEIVDPINIDSSSSTLRTHEILRCIQIGLLCVQERAEDRPVMSSVMVMLGSETTAITQPKRPGFCIGRSPLEADSSLSTQRGDECTVNQITVSVIDAR